MTVLAVTSLAGAPGVTTAATALAVHWPRPVVLVEADTSAASSLMAGFFRSNLRTTSGGIEKLSFAFSRDVLEAGDILDPELRLAIAVHDLPPVPSTPIPALPAGHRMWVIPGFANLNVADGIRGLWFKLPRLFDALGEGGIDVIVDLGRFGVDDPRLPVIDTVDRVVVCASASMVDLNRCYRRLELADLTQRVGARSDKNRAAIAGDRFWMLLSEPAAETIPSREFAGHLLPVLATLPHDPVGAAVFSHGRPDPKPSRNTYRAGIRGAVTALTSLSRDRERSIS